MASNLFWFEGEHGSSFLRSFELNAVMERLTAAKFLLAKEESTSLSLAT